MSAPPSEQTWFGNMGLPLATAKPEDSPEFVRLWHAFMASRLALGLVLVVLQGALYATGTGYNFDLVTISAVYFAITIVTRLVARPQPLGGSFNRRWVGLVGADVVAILILQHLQGSNINYTPLFALPFGSHGPVALHWPGGWRAGWLTAQSQNSPHHSTQLARSRP